MHDGAATPDFGGDLLGDAIDPAGNEACRRPAANFLRAGAGQRRSMRIGNGMRGLDYTTETSLTFSGQFFEFCRAHGARGVRRLVASRPARSSATARSPSRTGRSRSPIRAACCSI